MRNKTVQNETLEHREAFEYYYSLGETRGLQATSKFINKGFTTVKRWSISFKWQERVKQRDLELATELQKKTNHTILTSKVEYRGVIRTLVEQFKLDVADQKIKIRSIKDFDMIARLDMDLMGVDLDSDDDNLKSLAEVLQASAALIGIKPTNDISDDGEN